MSFGLFKACKAVSLKATVKVKFEGGDYTVSFTDHPSVYPSKDAVATWMANEVPCMKVNVGHKVGEGKDADPYAGVALAADVAPHIGTVKQAVHEPIQARNGVKV